MKVEYLTKVDSQIKTEPRIECYGRTIFKGAPEVIWDCLVFALLRSVSRKHSAPLSRPSDPKLKPIRTWPLVFSRALGSLVVFTVNSHWLLKVFSFF